MNERDLNDADTFRTLFREMDKYDFNKPYKLQVFVVENDQEVEIRDEKETEPRSIYDSGQIQSAFFQNSNQNQEVAEITEKRNTVNLTNNDLHNSETNMFTSCSSTTISLPPDQSINLNPNAFNNDLSNSYREPNLQLNNNTDELDILANNIINVLKAYTYYSNIIKIPKKDDLFKQRYREKYLHYKECCFQSSREIIARNILPQGKNFNMINFLLRTMTIQSTMTSNQYNFYCTYKDVETVYLEMLSSFRRKVYGNEVMSNYNIPTQSINHEPISTLQQNYQNHYNNVTQAISDIPNSTLQQRIPNNRYYNNIPQTNKNQPNSVLQCNYPNDQHFSNITQQISTERNSTVQQNRNNRYCNDITETIKNGSNFMYQQSSGKNSSNITQATGEVSVTILGELLQNKEHYNNTVDTVDNSFNTTWPPNHRNDRQSDNLIQINREPNTMFQQSNQNIDLQQNSMSQGLLDDSSTCVFQYKCPNYEVRMDVNTDILKNLNKRNQCISNKLHAGNPSHNNEQCTTDDVGNRVQLTEPSNALSTQVPNQAECQTFQEPTRPRSRDSGIMSPCNIQINDSCCNGEAQDPASPYITQVTSLNPEAMRLPTGNCYICGKLTKTKCLGCFNFYYCSNECQMQHWSRHKFHCTNAR